MDIQKLKQRKNELHLSYDELAEKSGIPKTTLTNIFLGRTPNPRTDTVEAIERALGIYTSRKIEKDPVIQDEVELQDYYPIPLLGSVVAGVPIEAQEDLEGYIYISFRPKEEYFALRVHGDSMINAGIADGAVIVVHKQECVQNNDIVVAMLNREQTVKRFKMFGDNVFLKPENPAYEMIPITEKDEFIILGKVVEVRFML